MMGATAGSPAQDDPERLVVYRVGRSTEVGIFICIWVRRLRRGIPSPVDDSCTSIGEQMHGKVSRDNDVERVV